MGNRKAAEWGELDSAVISPALQQIWAGEAEPENALPELCKQVDQFLKDKGYPKK